MTTHRVRTFTIVALMVGLSSAPYGQTRRRLMLVDLLNVPRLADPQLSPDGRQILYELAAADWKADKRVSHVWRVGVDGSGTVQMTDGPGEQGARWSPDGQTIVYVGKRTGEEAQIYQMSNSGGEGRPLTRHAELGLAAVLVAERPRSLLRRAGSENTRGAAARQSQRRCVRLRRKLSTDAPLEVQPGHARGNAADDWRFLRPRISTFAGRQEDRVPPRAESAVGLLGRERGLADVRRRVKRAATDEERRPRERRDAVPRQFPGPLHRAGQRTVRRVRQPKDFRRSGGRRPGPRHISGRHSVRGRARAVVEGWQVDRLAGEHGHARGALRDAVLGRTAASADRRQTRADGGGRWMPAGRSSRWRSRQIQATCGC